MAKKRVAGAKVSPAKYYALSSTAVDGVHFAAGDPIKGVTDRDQIALALRQRVIGEAPPSTAAPAPEVDDFDDKPEQGEGAELTGAGGDDATTDLGDRDAD